MWLQNFATIRNSVVATSGLRLWIKHCVFNSDIWSIQLRSLGAVVCDKVQRNLPNSSPQWDEKIKKVNLGEDQF